MLEPMYESLSEIEVLAALLGDADTGYASLRKTLAGTLGTDDKDRAMAISVSFSLKQPLSFVIRLVEVMRTTTRA